MSLVEEGTCVAVMVVISVRVIVVADGSNVAVGKAAVSSMVVVLLPGAKFATILAIPLSRVFVVTRTD